MSIPRTEARAITPRPIEPDETKAAAGGATKTKTSPLPPKGTQTLVDAAGKGRGSKLAAFAAAETGRARVEAARSAVGELARASGQDADAFAARYANSNKSPDQIKQEARFAFVQETLARHPEHADALIGVRLRGLDADTRELVTAAVRQSGAQGAGRYGACERSIAALAAFDKDGRGDILGRVRAGERFESAVALQKKDNVQIAAAEARARQPGSTTELTARALANAKANASAVRKLVGQVHRTVHAMGELGRITETLVGAGAATGTLGAGIVAAGEAAVTRSSAPLKKALHEADRAGAFMSGELSGKIRAANQTAVKLLQASDRFETVYARQVGAIRSGDHAGVAETAKQLETLGAEVKQHAATLADQAKAIGALNKDFDGAATHAALSVALAGVGYAVGSVPGVHHAVDAAGKATAARVAPVLGQAAAEGAKEVVHIGVHAGSEGLAARAYGAARH
jgi:hypothetical protein